MATDSGGANSAKNGSSSEMLVTEVPSALKELARIVARTFYSIEDSLIVDMLVRHPCLREDDICDLLKFDRKMLRSRMTGLKNDKFLMVKHKMETGEDEKAIKMNCYYINFKTFVNIVKYKLDHMHKKMETSERDATARSSFKCSACLKTFTDLEANELFDPMTNEFRCTFCGGQVDEDASAGPQHNSRALLARFNTQMERLYDLLRAVEDIKLAPVVLEPEPVELSHNSKRRRNNGEMGRDGPMGPGGNWSGEASRTGGFRVDSQQVNITFGENDKQETKKKEVPVWISESTVSSDTKHIGDPNSPEPVPQPSTELPNEQEDDYQTNDEITSLLLRHEKRNTSSTKARIPGESDTSDESDPEPDPVAAIASQPISNTFAGEEVMSEDDDDEDGDAPTIRVGNDEILLTDVTEEIIERMSTEEKERYTQLYQDLYSHMYE